MFTIRTDIDSKEALALLAKVQAATMPKATDLVVDRVALRTQREVVDSTPKKWFGQVRRSWQIEKPELGARVVKNDNKIMLFLEEGTQAHGPVTAKSLYIPLTRKAAIGGWNKGLKYGVDYILRKRVKGIEARHIAAQQSVKTQQYLLDAMVQHLQAAIK